MTAQATPYMRRRAAKIAKTLAKWARRDERGVVHYFFPASEQEPFEPVRAYQVDIHGRACSCPSHRMRGICAHVLAAQIVGPPEGVS